MAQVRRLVAAAAVVVVVGYAAADAADVVPGVLTTSSSTPTTPRPTASDPAPAPLQPALPALSTQAPPPTVDGVAAAVDRLLTSSALGPGVGAVVVDAATGQVLLDRDSSTARVPASTTKLLTAAAVLTTVGGDARLTTKVVQGASPDEVVLVGAGDMLLGTGASREDAVVGHAGLADLAAQVAQRLAADGRHRVAVRFDDSLFEGPTASPAWSAGDVRFGYTGRVTALGLGRDRAHPGDPGPADPSASAAAAFVQALGRQGVTVSGTTDRTRATADAAVLGQVQSATVADVLGLALTESDNALAEVLARLTARAMGRSVTFSDAAIAVLDQVQELGIDTGSATIVDGSGLGSGSRVPPKVLADVLALAAGTKEPRLRPMLAGLPVAGFTGTLADRFDRPTTRAAAGVVRAKTGTLTGVSSLAGSTVDADGRLLVLVVMADRVPAGGTLAARRAADQVAAALARWGCR
jgi:D-alanyl-D-alanine carboxypeptidase/D-alanyl-D-alanine-endopeptidase (penicillin-binding protein 4)